MRQPRRGKIKWPRVKSTRHLRAMTKRQALAYARDLHDAWAEEHRRRMEKERKSMEWDQYWGAFYRAELKRLRQTEREG